MRKKILIIDDEETIRKVMGKLLGRAGYEVFAIASGEEALKRLSSQQADSLSVDLIILDMYMPGMNGLEFLQKVRDQSVTTVPVLMLSGCSDLQIRVESYKLGAYDFIEKPELPEVMLKRVENGLKIGEIINYNEFIKTELIMAKKLQDYLFPGPFAMTDAVEINAWYRPLSDIGGDLYDYIFFRDGRIFFFVADVSGHSIPAAIFTTIVHMVFRNALKVVDSPGDVLNFMNKELSGNLPVEQFVTMFCGLIDPEKHTLEYGNAGHPKPCFLPATGEGPLSLEGNDAFLGPIPEETFTTFKRELAPGDAFLLYTDGFMDVYGSGDLPIGRELLVKTLHRQELSNREKFEAACANILSADIEITDDCTMMLVQYK
ncbi:MAG: SpoIIE family protein phosphatase [bacterium]|nr:SpoIIE family protein phosphatase [bacterium]